METLSRGYKSGYDHKETAEAFASFCANMDQISSEIHKQICFGQQVDKNTAAIVKMIETFPFGQKRKLSIAEQKDEEALIRGCAVVYEQGVAIVANLS